MIMQDHMVDQHLMEEVVVAVGVATAVIEVIVVVEADSVITLEAETGFPKVDLLEELLPMTELLWTTACLFRVFLKV